MMTPHEIRQFRLRVPERFDRILVDTLLSDDPALIDPVWWGDALNHVVNGKRRWLRGADALPHIMAVWVKADLCYERLFEHSCRFGLEEMKRSLPLGEREIKRAYEKRRRALHVVHSPVEIERLTLDWLNAATRSLLMTLNGTVENAKAHLRCAS